jgi:hypothetical protein
VYAVPLLSRTCVYVVLLLNRTRVYAVFLLNRTCVYVVLLLSSKGGWSQLLLLDVEICAADLFCALWSVSVASVSYCAWPYDS